MAVRAKLAFIRLPFPVNTSFSHDVDEKQTNLPFRLSVNAQYQALGVFKESLSLASKRLYEQALTEGCKKRYSSSTAHITSDFTLKCGGERANKPVGLLHGT